MKTNSIRAVGYLQTRLSDIIDHNDPEQLHEFHKLASLLFKCDDYLMNIEPQTSNSSRSSSSTMEIDTKPTVAQTTGIATENMTTACTTAAAAAATTSSDANAKIENKQPIDWSTKTDRYHNYTPPPPTICCYGGNTLKKDAELFTNKTEEQQFEVKNQRCLLYNKLIELMPDHMVQPKGNLSDFVII